MHKIGAHARRDRLDLFKQVMMIKVDLITEILYQLNESFHREYLISSSDVPHWEGAQTFCTNKGLELVKWDTLEEYEDSSFIASISKRSSLFKPEIIMQLCAYFIDGENEETWTALYNNGAVCSNEGCTGLLVTKAHKKTLS